MGTMGERLTLVVATPLPAELVERIRSEVPEVEVLFEPDLLPPTRFSCDHQGDPDFRRGGEDQERFESMLARADVLLGVPGETPEALRQVVSSPRLRWVQGTAAGAGQQVRAAGLDPATLERVVFTSAVGVHATQLAEWATLGLLYFLKDVPRLERDARRRTWTHYALPELAGRRLLVVGLGHIGREVARQARSLGMTVTGVRRNPAPEDLRHVDVVGATAELAELVPCTDDVVLALPETDATRGLFTADLVAAIPQGGVLVNVGRGSTLDQDALVSALESGRLRGAALDVTEPEPLPEDNVLWSMPNVLVSPHTAALSERENERIVDLLIDNLRRFAAGEPLRNRVDVDQFY